jgi:NADH/NAD ratio-sensing transcriptional regulator Rex
MKPEEIRAFYQRLDHAIISGESSGTISKRLGVNSATVRRRRTVLRKAGNTIEVRGANARISNVES